MNKYEDIINLPHHISKKHPKMPIEKRAFQFAPFAALTGYNDLIDEISKIRENKKELDEDEKILLNNKLNLLNKNIKNKPEIIITYFDNDKQNTGIYKTIEVRVKKVDIISQQLVLDNNEKILFENIYDILEIENNVE